MQYFGKRKAQSAWSKINKIKVELLIQIGLMRDAGLETIDIAKKNGSWTILDDVKALIIPNDLEQALEKLHGAREYFLGLSRSVKQSLLQWIVLAKNPETRNRRILEIAKNASLKIKPKQFR